MSVTDIMLALSSPDILIRGPAEQTVNQAKEADLGGFLVALIGELRDESKPSVARQMAGIVLKNSVALHLRDVDAREALEAKWKCLPATVRGSVKSEVLQTLGSDNREVRNIAAIIVGNLSRIELPAGEWPEILPTLVQVANSTSEQHVEAALTALGYICEEAGEYDEVETVLQQHNSDILNAVGRGMSSESENIKYSATNALCNAMEFIHSNMEKKEERDYLVRIVCDAATKCSTQRTREKAMECLVKVAELYYQTLPEYINELHQITTNAVVRDVEAVGLQAMLFWIAICDRELEILGGEKPNECLNYAKMGAQQLVDLCLQCLQRQEEGQTEDDWNLSIAGGKLLQSLAETINDPIQGLVMPFVFRNINSTNWRECEAAVMAFGCILSGPDPKAIEDTVAQALPGLFEYIRHSNEMIADTSAWVLTVVCELFPDAFLEVPQNLQTLLNIIGPMLTGDNGGMATRAAHMIHNLGLAYEDEEDQSSNALSSFYEAIVQALLSAIDKYANSTERVALVAQESLNCIVDAAAADCFPILLKLIPEILSRLDRIVSQNGAAVSPEVSMMQGLMCGTLGSVARKLKIGMMPLVNDTATVLTKILQQKSETVLEEALLAVGALAQACGGAFHGLVPRFLPFILSGLQQTDQDDLMQQAVGCIGDVAAALGERFADYAESVLASIRDTLSSDTVEREVKLSLLSCVGDIALNLGSAGFQPYLSTFTQLVQSMYQFSKTINYKGDFDTEDYIMGLWTSIAQFYTGVCQCFNGDVAPLVGNMQEILAFALEVAGNTKEYPDVFSAVIGVIGDLANILITAPANVRQNGKNSLCTDHVRQVLNFASKWRDQEDVKRQALWAQKQIVALERA